MKDKRKRYHTDLEGRGVFFCGCFLGLAFFLRGVFYFGFTRTETVDLWTLIMMLILPWLLEAAFITLLRGVRLDAPGLYGILGAVYCLLLVLQCIQYESLIRMILGIIAYVICGGLLLGVSAGYLSRELGAVSFFTVGAVRFLLALGDYVLPLRLVAFLPEAAGLCAVLALGCLTLGMKQKK
ncbi:MAG: hypothetical protein IJW45_09205 [Oscillospiraceae bacterium]|nr:hypothetical protein [Oscillospiraceae bacterium]